MAIGLNNSNSIGHFLNQQDNRLSTSFAKLSSGKQINSAKDNAAGLAIVERFAAQINGVNQAYRNTNDGISMAQTADGYSAQITDLMQRGRDLANQSANALLSDSDRAMLQTEFAMLQDEVGRITDSADFNGQSLLNTDAQLDFQVDADATDQVSVKTFDLKNDLSMNGFFSADLSSQAGSTAALSVMDSSMQQVNLQRSEYGATLNRFESIGNNLLNKDENLSASKSRILDTDYAKTMSEHSRDLLLREATTALNSQANFSARQILGLLG